MTRSREANKVKLIAYCGLMAAIIAVATGFIKIPIAIGYMHIGDGFIFLAAALLGPYGAIAAGVGSGLADLLAGYYIYIPVTFVIKVIMGLIAAYSLKHGQSVVRCVITFVLAELVMIFGYFAFESILYGIEAAAAVVISNSIQGILGVVIGTIAVKLICNKINPEKLLK